MIYDESESQPTSGKELYNYWQTQIDETFQFIEDRYWADWDRYRRLYAGNHWDEKDYKSRDQSYKNSATPATEITCNLLRPWANQITSYIVNRDGYLGIEPLNTESISNAILLEAAANKEWQRCYVKSCLEESFLSAAIMGSTVAEAGYTIEVDESANPDDDGHLEYRDYVKIDQPFVRKINLYNFAYDLTAPGKNLETARWVCEEFFQEPSYVLNNKRYIKATRDAIRRGDEKPQGINENDLRVHEMPQAMKGLWKLRKLWDRRFRKFYIFCKGVEKPLVERAWPYDYIPEFPIKMFNYIKSPGEYFGTSMFEDLEDGQYELNRTLTAMCDYRRRNTGGQSQITEVGSPDMVKSFNSGDRLVVTGDAKIEPISTVPFAPDQYNIISFIISNMERVSGLSEITQGATTGGRRSATSDRIRSQFTMMRIDGMAENWNRFVKEIGYDWVRHIQYNYVTPRMVALTGALGSYWIQIQNSQRAAAGEQPLEMGADNRVWVEYGQADLQGDMQINLESTVKPKQDAQMEMQSRMQYVAQLQQLMAVAAQTGKPFDMQPIEVAKWMGEPGGYDKSLPRMVSNAAIVPPPVATQAGQQPQPQMMNQQQQMMSEAAPIESAIAGAMTPQSGNGAY